MPQPVNIPRPVSAQEIMDATNTVPAVPMAGQFVSLPALFQYRGENIDYQMDAKTEPSTFSPLCSFSGTLVLRGGGCKLAFGWYNAVASGGAPPPANEIYPLIPNDDPVVYGGPAFTPLATDGPWTLKTFTAADIRNDVRYLGGQIGFALIGGAQCTQTKYSQRELNQKCTSCTPMEPFITTVVYEGTKEPNSYYLGFEDLPVSPTGFLANNDGDFNDFVFYITGLVCKGGGEPCMTGKMGACALGKTDCSENEEPGQCRDVVKPTDERCDNVDNDCDGQVDDGDELCPVGKVCDHGSCVPACNTGEFQCRKPLECDRGFCLDPKCIALPEPCAEGKACRAGICVGACDGVTCPIGQECQLGACVDLCTGVVCEGEQVCENGLCMAKCGCRGCGAGQACAPSGECVDTGCEGLTCMAGQVCVQGACKDACEGAMCPGGTTCAGGVCPPPPIMDDVVTGGSANTAGSPPILIDRGGTAGTGSGGTGVIPGTGGSGGTGATGNGAVVKKDGSTAGCACRVGSDSSGSGTLAWLSLAGAAAVWARRRRRLSA
ncbi:MAG TPA: DUF4114 domain-containing protein [Polyangiaceae bacterium]